MNLVNAPEQDINNRYRLLELMNRGFETYQDYLLALDFVISGYTLAANPSFITELLRRVTETSKELVRDSINFKESEIKYNNLLNDIYEQVIKMRREFERQSIEIHDLNEECDRQHDAKVDLSLVNSWLRKEIELLNKELKEKDEIIARQNSTKKIEPMKQKGTFLVSIINK